MLIPRHSEVYGRAILSSERKKISITKNPAPANRIDNMFSSEICFGTEFRVVASSAEWFGTDFQVFAYILFHGTESPVDFSSAEWFRMEFLTFASNFVPWYIIPSIFLLCGTVRNGIRRISCYTEQPEFRRNKPIVLSIPSSAE